MMKKENTVFNIMLVCFVIIVVLVSANRKAEQEELVEGFEPVTYKEAYDFAVKSEKNIINSNSHQKANKYDEPAWEVIIYSDEYRALYCTYWSALEEVGESDEDKFGKNKFRWELDFTNEEWRKVLIDAFNNGGADAFFSEYSNMYVEKVLPATQKQWDENH